MKKVLFGTTALVAAAFAGQALAGDVKLSITGDVTAGVGVGEYQEDTVAGDPGIDKDFHIINEAEIQFKAKGTLDNGIGIEVRVELEGYTTGDQMDENWVKVKSSFGTILIGNNDTALDNVAGGIGRMGGGIAGGSWDRGYEFVPGSEDQHLGDYSDNMAIHYYTPNIAGFEAGVSFAPGTDSDEADVDTNLDLTNSNDGISIGVSYGNSFGDVDFAIGGGYYTENDGDANGGDDASTYGGGLEIGFGGFTLGGAVEFRSIDVGFDENSFGDVYGLGHTAAGDYSFYGAGVEYATGPWVFGVNGMIGDFDSDEAGAADYETLRVNAAVGYELGDGVDLGLGIDYGEFENDDPTVEDEDSFGGVLLLGVSF